MCRAADTWRAASRAAAAVSGRHVLHPGGRARSRGEADDAGRCVRGAWRSRGVDLEGRVADVPERHVGRDDGLPTASACQLWILRSGCGARSDAISCSDRGPACRYVGRYRDVDAVIRLPEHHGAGCAAPRGPGCASRRRRRRPRAVRRPAREQHRADDPGHVSGGRPVGDAQSPCRLRESSTRTRH